VITQELTEVYELRMKGSGTETSFGRKSATLLTDL
jgi:hypothetical protein